MYTYMTKVTDYEKQKRKKRNEKVTSFEPSNTIKQREINSRFLIKNKIKPS